MTMPAMAPFEIDVWDGCGVSEGFEIEDVDDNCIVGDDPALLVDFEIEDIDDDYGVGDEPAGLIIEVGYRTIKSCGRRALNVLSVG